jgi:D-alanyl-D-alanine carboxypeptidase/D-alanyl-D-alanine-endopeptidase (penicillin-binding protein 4)
MRKLRVGLLAAAALAGAALAAASELSPEVMQALRRERIPLDAVAVLVQEAGSATTRVGLNALRPMNPASVFKLLTTYAALEQLGPAYTWKTPVWFAGTVKDGVLDGNLHLQGRGDPKLTIERVWLALQRIRAMGVREIRGDIVIDQSMFAVPETSTADFDNEPLRPYNARAQALLLNLSAVIYTFTPAAARGVAIVSAEPWFDRTRPETTVPLSSAPCGDWRGALKAAIDDPLHVHFAGSYPATCGERTWALAHSDARQYTAQLLATLWRDSGGELGGSVREGPPPADAAPLFELTSPPLADVVRDINKYSNNVMAQQVFLTLGLERNGGAGTTPEDARQALLQWLGQRQGEPVQDGSGLVIDNGSGLSRDTRVSAALLARVLQRAWSSEVMPELIASLPVTGVDGTLRHSRATPGRAHLKTGALRGVTALAGFVLGASGKRYVLVALVNHPNAGAARPALDALVQWTMNDLNTRAAGARR